MCLRGLGESLSVGFERANPQVECALGRNALVAELRKAAIQGFAVLRIGLNIARLVNAALDDVLQKRRRAHEAKRAARAAHGVEGAFPVGHGVGYENVANALAWQAERFGIRVAYERVLVDRRNERHAHVAVDDFAIRLIGDDVNGDAEFVLLAAQRVGEFDQVAFGVHRANRVVGRINHDGLGFRRNGVFDGFDVHLEIVAASGHLDAVAAGVLNPNLVFGEIGRNHDELVARVSNGVEADGKRCGGAAGHVDVRTFVRRIEAAVERCGHGGANARCALAGGVAVHLGGGLLHHIENCSLNRFGRRNAGVADAEVEDVILADFGLACLAVCEQLANRRRFAAQLVHALIDHGALVSPRAPTGGVAGFLHASMIKRKGRESWGMEPFFCRWKRKPGRNTSRRRVVSGVCRRCEVGRGAARRCAFCRCR